jgi:lipopolysaccharide/colanic/teichoic acid biosynthesis glycosyltransferase
VPVYTVALRVWTPARRFLTIAGSALAGLVLLPILLVVALIVSVKVSRLGGSGIDS